MGSRLLTVLGTIAVVALIGGVLLAALHPGGDPSGNRYGRERMPNSRRNAERAARYPLLPWTPPPGGVDDEQR